MGVLGGVGGTVRLRRPRLQTDTGPRWDGTEQIVAYVQPGCGIFIAPLG